MLTRLGRSILSSLGGHFIPSTFICSATDIGFDSTNTITLYAEGLKENENIKYYEDVKSGPKQNSKITVQLFEKNFGEDNLWLGKDQVRYVVAKPDTFYYQMVRNYSILGQDLRAAAASAGIYGSNDLPNFGLQLLASGEAGAGNTTGLSVCVNQKNGGNDGFNAGVYYDYCSKKYLVAFEGTDPSSIADWWNNIYQFGTPAQFMFGTPAQYKKAMEIGVYVNTYCDINDVIFTGHSLGGGLASAATIFAVPENYSGTQRAYTFNAAAIQGATLEQYKQQENIDDGGRAAYNYLSKAQTLVLAYIVRGELLDTLQRAASPRAFGGKQRLEHNQTLILMDYTQVLSLDFTSICSLFSGENRLTLHYMDKVIEGLERLRGIR